MKILVDADACPVVDIVLRLAKKYGHECLLLCDTSHEMRRDGATTLVLDKGADSVDFALVNLVQPGDIVVTQDYGLAAMCLARKAQVVNQNGLVYTSENIDTLLDSRYVSGKIRRAGGRTKGPPKRTPVQDASFTQAFEFMLKVQESSSSIP